VDYVFDGSSVSLAARFILQIQGRFSGKKMPRGYFFVAATKRAREK
jgi:hypothetical protein